MDLPTLSKFHLVSGANVPKLLDWGGGSAARGVAGGGGLRPSESKFPIFLESACNSEHLKHKFGCLGFFGRRTRFFGNRPILNFDREYLGEKKS